LKLYPHPFSSYCQKVLIALYGNAAPFEYRNLEDATASAELATLWPLTAVARAVDEARPFRSYFPLGAPDRD
jgi:glutathione S-transferase